MFKIEENVIHLTRGDMAAIELEIQDYTFKVDDVIRFAVYSKKGLSNEPFIEKTITIDEEKESVVFTLSPEDTKIGPMENKAIEYWYEFELNGSQTVLGFDEEGAKKLILYPEGVEDIE